MKKLYRKGTVHPSPPIISDHLSFLPATILTLTAALSPEDREVLAYLISSSSSSNNNNNNNNNSPNPRRTTNNNNNNNSNNQKAVVDGDHPPLFHCSCFRCYMSYWARWDSSPNHQLIHEIIDAYEDWLAQTTKTPKTKKKDKRNKRGSNGKSEELKRPELVGSPRMASDELESVGESSNIGGGGGGGDDEVGEGGDGGDAVEGEEKGSVRRFVSFIGEKIWGAWGQ